MVENCRHYLISRTMVSVWPFWNGRFTLLCFLGNQGVCVKLNKHTHTHSILLLPHRHIHILAHFAGFFSEELLNSISGSLMPRSQQQQQQQSQQQPKTVGNTNSVLPRTSSASGSSSGIVSSTTETVPSGMYRDFFIVFFVMQMIWFGVFFLGDSRAVRN